MRNVCDDLAIKVDQQLLPVIIEDPGNMMPLARQQPWKPGDWHHRHRAQGARGEGKHVGGGSDGRQGGQAGECGQQGEVGRSGVGHLAGQAEFCLRGGGWWVGGSKGRWVGGGCGVDPPPPPETLSC